MTKRKLAFIALGFITLGALVGSYFGFVGGDGTMTLTFEQNDLQQRISTKLDQRAETGHKVEIRSVKLDLSDDKIALDIEAGSVVHMPITHREVPLSVRAYTKGTLRYGGGGLFYFKADELKLKDFTVDESHVSDKVGKLIDKWITSPKLLDRKEELMDKAQILSDKAIERAAETYLAVRPVYEMPNNGWKYTLARIALQDVKVKDGKVFVTLSIWHATAWLITAVLTTLGCILLAGALAFTVPTWGLALIALPPI